MAVMPYTPPIPRGHLKLWLALALAGAVLSADTLTKLIDPANTWTLHRDALSEAGSPSLPVTLIVIVALVVCTLGFRSVGFAVAAAGVIGNVAWAVATGAVPNPIVERENADWLIAYNVADVAIQAGMIVAAAEVGVWVARHAGRAILRTP